MITSRKKDSWYFLAITAISCLRFLQSATVAGRTGWHCLDARARVTAYNIIVLQQYGDGDSTAVPPIPRISLVIKGGKRCLDYTECCVRMIRYHVFNVFRSRKTSQSVKKLDRFIRYELDLVEHLWMEIGLFYQKPSIVRLWFYLRLALVLRFMIN